MKAARCLLLMLVVVALAISSIPLSPSVNPSTESAPVVEDDALVLIPEQQEFPLIDNPGAATSAATRLGIAVEPATSAADPAPVTTSGRGGDVQVTGHSFAYTGGVTDYDCMSSNAGCITLTLDAVVGVNTEISVDIQENTGTATGTFSLIGEVIQANTVDLVLWSDTVSTSLAASGTNTIAFATPYNPSRGGNHTLQITVVNSGDTNTANDIYTSFVYTAIRYFKMDTLEGFNPGNNWGAVADVGITGGPGTDTMSARFPTTGSYGASVTDGLTSPSFDTTDGSGEILFNMWFGGETDESAPQTFDDGCLVQIKNNQGQWFNILGSPIGPAASANTNNWTIWSITYGSVGSRPGFMSSNSQFFHSTFQFRCLFTSDADTIGTRLQLDDFFISWDESVDGAELGYTLNPLNNNVNADPGSAASFTVNTTNTGGGGPGATDSLSFSIPNLPTGWSTLWFQGGVGFNPTNGITVPKGEARDIVVEVTPSSTATPGLTALTVIATSSLNSTVTTSTTLNVDVNTDYTATIDPITPSSALPGQDAGYTVTVNNNGNTVDSYTLTLDTGSLPSGWQASFDGGVNTISSVPSGGSDTAGLTVTPSSGAMFGESGTVTVNFVSQGDGSVTGGQQVLTTADQVLGINVVTITSTPVGVPGSIEVIEFDVTNTGNGDDQFLLTSSTQSAWSASVNVTQNPLTITGGETKRIEVFVSVIDRPVGTLERVTLEARSQTDSQFVSSAFTDLEVGQKYDIALQRIGSGNLIISPGQSGSVDIDIWNYGNGPDTAQMLVDTSSLPTGWNTLLEGPALNLQQQVATQPGQRTNVSFTVTLPTTAVSGQIITLGLEAASSGTDVADTDNIISVAVEVGQVYSGEYSVPTTMIDVLAGEKAEFDAQLTNTGNGQDTFHIQLQNTPALPSGWLAFVRSGGDVAVIGEDMDFTLAADDFVQIVVEVTTPTSAPVNTVVQINLMMTSDGGWSLQGPISLEVHISQDYGVELTGESKTTIKPGKSTKFVVSVLNSGTGDDTFTLTAQAPDDWDVTLRDTILLGKEGGTEITVEVEAPDDAEDQTVHQVTIRAQSVNPAAFGLLYVNLTVEAPTGLFGTSLLADAPPGVVPVVSIGVFVVLATVAGGVLVWALRGRKDYQDKLDFVYDEYANEYTSAYTDFGEDPYGGDYDYGYDQAAGGGGDGAGYGGDGYYEDDYY